MLHGIPHLHHPSHHPLIHHPQMKPPPCCCLSSPLLSFPFTSLKPKRLHPFRTLSSLRETKKPTLRKASNNLPQNLKFENNNSNNKGGDVAGSEGEFDDGGDAAIKGTLLAGLILVGVVGGFGSVGYIYKDQINAFLTQFSSFIDGYGPAGYALFVTVYAGLEILAIPAIPLTMSAGLLFGSFIGTIIVSISGTVAATVAFLIARYFARERILKLVEGDKKFLAIDKAIGENGFRVVTLLRLSPLLPFSLGNYLYGLTSVKLVPYVLGSWLGMLPGTWAYVSAGAFGRAIIQDESEFGFPGGNGQLLTTGLGLFATALAAAYVTRLAKSWVNSPPCDNCGRGTSNIGIGAALPSEIEYGGSRVELYRCNYCSSITRFPRYNDPLKLLQTRRGRCGEWANCFTLYCRAFGYESRLIVDFTDHVWTECFSHYLGRWMHLDPCEGVFDNPLLYEQGWNKKLNYVIAIAKDGVYDVTKRYTRKWHEVSSRRNITTEANVSSVLSSITNECRARYSSEALSVLSQCDKKENEELEGDVRRRVDDSLSLPGRQSGALEWRMSRSELGSNGLSSSSCPVRTCVDSHVTDICNALSVLLFQFFDNSYPKPEIIEVFMNLRRLLVNLKNSPFRARRSFVNLNTAKFSEKMMSSIEGLISSISLKWELESDGACVFLAGNPVQTSLALPVALDSVDEIIDNLKDTCFGKDVIGFPKANRLSSGLVLASGEELPIGIAISAFDGIRLSKWEEPNGAKGCWLLYKVFGDQMHDLESYELMSANDAPERDPMDWILEGSDDGGVSWFVLDKQSSQLFEKRFQRKSFRVDSVRKSNAFRFHFMSVRDSATQSRFQIGSIDFYIKLS